MSVQVGEALSGLKVGGRSASGLAQVRCPVCGGLAGSSDLSVSVRMRDWGTEVVYAHLACAPSQLVDARTGDTPVDGFTVCWQLQLPWVDGAQVVSAPTLVVSVAGLNTSDGHTLGTLGLVAVSEPELPPQSGWTMSRSADDTLTVAASGVDIFSGLPCSQSWWEQTCTAGFAVLMWCATALPEVDGEDDAGVAADVELAALADAGVLAATTVTVSST